MQPRDERRIVHETYQQLRDEFSDVPEEFVEAVVRIEHAALTGPVRQFVPILLRRRSTARLQRLREDLNGPAHPPSGVQPWTTALGA